MDALRAIVLLAGVLTLAHARTVTVVNPDAAAHVHTLLAALPAPAVSARTLADPADSLDDLARVLATQSAADALASSLDPELVQLLSTPPYNRTARCELLLECDCDPDTPWPTCDARLHLKLLDAARPRVAPKSASSVSLPGIQCEGFDSFFAFATSTSTTTASASRQCVDTYCELPLPFGSVYGAVSGCVTRAFFWREIANGLDTCEVCTADGHCASLTVADLAYQGGYLLDESLSGTVGVCIHLDVLAAFGLGPDLCADVDGVWWYNKGQISVEHGQIEIGWSLANVYARLDGRVQVVGGSDNPLCQLNRFDTFWTDQECCAWSAGDGHVTLEIGWEFLFFGSSETIVLLDSTA